MLEVNLPISNETTLPYFRSVELTSHEGRRVSAPSFVWSFSCQPAQREEESSRTRDLASTFSRSQSIVEVRAKKKLAPPINCKRGISCNVVL